MGRRRRLNRRPVSIIACSVGLPAIAILGQWGERERERGSAWLPRSAPPPASRSPTGRKTSRSPRSGSSTAPRPPQQKQQPQRRPCALLGCGRPMRGGGRRCLGLAVDEGAAARAMAHVRLSNGSPTLERMEARRAGSPKPSACRSLFGPLDHDELARELARHRRHLAEASRAKWNFDFQHHRPLDGRYEWRALDAQALPDFYSRPPRLRAHRPDPDHDATAGPRKRPPDAPDDDSSHQNKRANTTEEISEDSPSASSVEQTPKKPSSRRHQT